MFALINIPDSPVTGFALKSPLLQWCFEIFLGKEAVPLDARKISATELEIPGRRQILQSGQGTPPIQKQLHH
jgi:hypothetical protein